MTKITHSTMSRGGKDISMPRDETKMHIIDDMSDATTVTTEDDELDRKLAEFEGVDNTPPTIDTPPKDAPTTYNAPKKQSSEEQKKVLESLIFMGRHTKNIEIADHKFEISTLTHKEHNNIVKELMTFGDAADLFTIRILTLAYAIRSIDGIPLGDFDIGGEFESEYHKRTTIVDSLQLALVEKLHDAYEEMVEEAESVVYHEAVKN